MFAVTSSLAAPASVLAHAAHVRAPKSSRAARVTTCAAADKVEGGGDGESSGEGQGSMDDDVYIGKARGIYSGKGRFIKDDKNKYAGRDDWFTGGWPGGEVALKEVFIQKPLPEMVPPEEGFYKPVICDEEFPEDFQGEDDVYIGKARGVYSGPGRYMKGDKTKFAGREDQVTGGWTGGEMALKLKDQLALKKGDYVAIKKSGGILGSILALFNKEDARKTGTVKKVEFDKSGKVTVSVALLPFDNVVEFNGDQLEIIEQ